MIDEYHTKVRNTIKKVAYSNLIFLHFFGLLLTNRKKISYWQLNYWVYYLIGSVSCFDYTEIDFDLYCKPS